MKFVLASRNKGKLAEMQRILGQLGVEVVLQSDLGLALEPEENGTTFAENAMIKAKAVMQAAAGEPKPLHFSYEEDDDVVTKLEKLAVNVYGAKDIELSAAAKKDLKQIQELGFDRLPVCVAKTPYSLSHEPTWLGAPKGFTLPVQRLILNAGAGFVVATTGAIMRMPGLPKQPAALHIDVVNGKIVGLS